MGKENTEVVRRAFEAYVGGDVEALLEVLDPDIEIRSLLTEAERPIYRGHEGARDWFAAVLDVFPDWQPNPEEIREVAGGVLTTLRVTATATESGVPIDQKFSHAARLREGKIVYFGFFRTEADALESLRPG